MVQCVLQSIFAWILVQTYWYKCHNTEESASILGSGLSNIYKYCELIQGSLVWVSRLYLTDEKAYHTGIMKHGMGCTWIYGTYSVGSQARAQIN